MTDHLLLPNPEADWASRPAPSTSLRCEVEARIGPTAGPIERLSGGLANDNIRVGTDRVLRILRRDPDQAQKERHLLDRQWTDLRVPRVLGGGDDFHLLEYVPHEPLRGTQTSGELVGRALAEIHSTRFEDAGFLGPHLTIRKPLADFIGALQGHVETMLGPLGEDWSDLRARVNAALQSANDADSSTQGSVLLHGDFKPSNLHWAKRLLVLDWEFAYAGLALMDIGQLIRWSPGRLFVEGFADGYQAAGGQLSDDWVRSAAVHDLGNLVGLVGAAPADSRRLTDIRRRIEETVRDIHA